MLYVFLIWGLPVQIFFEWDIPVLFFEPLSATVLSATVALGACGDHM